MTHTYLTKILVLPDAGAKNPFQYQLIAYLKSYGFLIYSGKKRKLFSIYSAVKNANPEIVYFDWVHSFIIGSNLLISCFKSITFCLEIIFVIYVKKLRIIHTAHNIQNHGKKWLLLEHWVYHFFLQHCHRIRVYSEAVREDISHRFRLPPTLIHVVQDIPFHHYYPNFTTQTQSRSLLSIDSQAFVYLFFGRIRSYKGLENLIDSFIAVANPENYLILAGESLDTKYSSALQKMTGLYPKIIWYNRFIEKEEVQLFFKAADVVVLPFLNIDHSGSVDLALSFSKPIITLKTRTMENLLTHQSALLFQKPDQLQHAMMQVKTMNLEDIGSRNFKIADAANYHDLLKLFEMYKS